MIIVTVKLQRRDGSMVEYLHAADPESSTSEGRNFVFFFVFFWFAKSMARGLRFHARFHTKNNS